MKVRKQQVKQKKLQKMKLGNNKEQVAEPEPVVEPKVETPATQIEEKEEKPIETQPKQVEVKQEKKTPRFCVDGGSEHVEGDGPNDHGYYNTWDEAWNACKEYLKTLNTSFNYRVDRCQCGLYYFWVKV